jgi:hypothetical protein
LEIGLFYFLKHGVLNNAGQARRWLGIASGLNGAGEGDRTLV